MVLYVRTQMSPNKKNNEDSALINKDVINCGNYFKINEDDGFIVAAADGVGGYRGASIASNYALASISVDFYKKYEELSKLPKNRVCQALGEMIMYINSEMIRKAKDMEDMSNMATTIAGVAEIDEEQYLFYVGNTRIYTYRNYKVELLTRDHTTLNQMLDSGEITPEQAKVLPKSNEINACMGSGDPNMLSRLVVRNISSIFEKNNLVFITTDGIHDFVRKEIIEKVITDTLFEFGIDGMVSDFTSEKRDNEEVNKNMSTANNLVELMINCLDKMADRLIQKARLEGSKDDETIVIVLK